MVRQISFETIAKAVESLCISANYDLPDDVLSALEKAKERESDPSAKAILEQIVENAKIANAELIPLCQDTGLTVVFVEQGSKLAIEKNEERTIADAINEGVKRGYENGYLRKSVVSEPLKERTNTKTNTPAIIHYSIVSGDKLKISIMAKGGGCENKSRFKMFKPTAASNDVTDWIVKVVKEAGADACPPFVVGVGIGGNFEQSCLLSKKALLRRLDDRNNDKFYADLEEKLLEKINALGVGPQGLGGDTTALGCMIEVSGCHIASLPVAVNIECHSHRHKEVVI